jgi:hypothetical protein
MRDETRGKMRGTYFFYKIAARGEWKLHPTPRTLVQRDSAASFWFIGE